MDQLCVADITYIRREVYLAVILDAFSRKVVGWALDRTLANRLTITTLEQAMLQWRRRLGRSQPNVFSQQSKNNTKPLWSSMSRDGQSRHKQSSRVACIEAVCASEYLDVVPVHLPHSLNPNGL
jgi:transposase InsO family protein